jgi:hypothetical protein
MTRNDLAARMRAVAARCQAAEFHLRASSWSAPYRRTGPVVHLSQANAALLNAANEVDPPDSLGELTRETSQSAIVCTILFFAGIVVFSLTVPARAIAPTMVVWLAAAELARFLYVRGYRRRRLAEAARSTAAPPPLELLVADLAELIAAMEPTRSQEREEAVKLQRIAAWHLDHAAAESAG